ncbi:TatD family hydrolase [Fervidicoccus fontis]|uniref:TatD family deoxyribonuclease n=1 Tax=Fervidicoccus fontis TaxID=683846 RepID=A0A2J6N3P3_9CREN|nr:TatD family hydrolase [Fervidicoccus fontis]PMB75939.1 MAG: TatD family deoxyribonuclease [Fervidicoccus fontis]PMB77428.1 MAG: TatD family deoxyribonuclease [Fervidicoccus fontis]HEW63919.1 TatD family deoxyribonuclease [Fervidicoccus fontis]
MISAASFKYIDAHTHAYEYEEKSLSNYEKEFLLIAVSDDAESSKRTVKLSEDFKAVYPCVGIHPWNVSRSSREDIKTIENMLENSESPCLGEVGLDARMHPETFERQKEFFASFLDIAREYDAILNIHALDAWELVYELITKKEINRAIFHWYNGPIELMQKIQETGYYISINVALKMQKKHEEVARKADLKKLLTESDGPYIYKGTLLKTEMIPEAIKYLAEIKGVGENYLREKIYENFFDLVKKI